MLDAGNVKDLLFILEITRLFVSAEWFKLPLNPDGEKAERNKCGGSWKLITDRKGAGEVDILTLVQDTVG